MTTYGFPIYTRFQDNTNRLCFEGRPDRVVDFMKDLPPGATLLDIGANQGAMSILAAQTLEKKGGTVLSFEPSGETASRLEANIALNKAENITVFQCAIGSKKETRSIGSDDPLHSGGAHIDGGSEQINILPIAEIPRIYDYISDGPIFAKIDTEGFELEVLKGLNPLLENGRVKKIIIEIDNNNLDRFNATPSSIYSLLNDYGFNPQHGLELGHYDEVFTKTDYQQ